MILFKRFLWRLPGQQLQRRKDGDTGLYQGGQLVGEIYHFLGFYAEKGRYQPFQAQVPVSLLSG